MQMEVGINEIIEEITENVCQRLEIKDGFGINNNADQPDKTLIKLGEIR